ncbi:hypothetical protein DI09_5p480 [Mitosporidium daphniae]|uniref:protein disulfide-isomerase n=1 Tax=Mitosporidium daphniae TaxID=1485682 RepID=A0A098VSI7_9MICR|nr:uncharacterized protein DI09_5p480 [Mitosporidium daphniae]KGG50701.1 hypothetical protein DI09_5p480 [Mitosporidium daphniae]|eukprot:XP_013237128.1 uncharacterized protein DI09_5p480 [Mitosporidium daphniae]
MIFKAPILVCVLFLVLSAIDLYSCVHVVSLNEGNFSHELEGCGHCNKLKPKLEEAAKTVSQLGFNIYSVSCEDDSQLCQKFQISGYPSLILFHNAIRVKDYPNNAAREVPEIVEFIKKENSPAFSTINSDEDLAAMLSDKTAYSVIAIIPEDHPKKLEAIEKVGAMARANRDLASFAITHLSKSDHLKPYPEATFLIISENITHLTSDLLKDDVLTQVHRLKLPLYGKLDEETYQSYSEAKLPIGFLFVTPEEAETYKEMMTDIAKKFSDLISIVWFDSTIYGIYANTLGLSGMKFPCFAIHDMETGFKFPFSEDVPLDSDHISNFIEEVFAGKISPYYKSEPIPAHNDSAPVQKLVFNSLSTVLNSSKAVFINFCVPNHEGCIAFAPNYLELANSFKDQHDKVLFVEFDLNQNDLPLEIESTIEKIPALYLYLPETKSFSEFVKFEGKPYKTKLAEFLVASCTHGLKSVVVDSDDHISQNYESNHGYFDHDDADSGFGSDSMDFEEPSHDDV